MLVIGTYVGDKAVDESVLCSLVATREMTTFHSSGVSLIFKPFDEKEEGSGCQDRRPDPILTS